MSINQNFAGATVLRGPKRLEGTDRGLDAIVGLVILTAELMIGVLSVYALYLYGVAALAVPGVASDDVQAGFIIALVGGGIAVVVTTLIYLVRVARGRRSWAAPLWGLILLTAACVVGYLVMGGAG